MIRFRDRADGGRALAAALRERYAGRAALVLGLPRGGVPVAVEVAAALAGELDVFVVRKLGVPGHPELAAGAVATGGVTVVNDDVLRIHRLDAETLRRLEDAERAELARRERAYRGDRPPPALSGRVVVLVDDGLATGASMRAAVQAARAADPQLVVAAAPVAAPEAVRALQAVADDVVVVDAPAGFTAVGAHYDEFAQTSDEEVIAALRAGWRG